MFLIEEDNSPLAYIKKSKIHGYGLFASQDLNENFTLIDYNLFPKYWEIIKWSDLTQDQINKNWYIYLNEEECVTNNKSNKFNYINHSRTPNCNWLISDKLIITNTKIKKDEELFIDYRLEIRPNRNSFPNWI